jgi:5-carboxymethyl-2-hydroxymuconate isomerase
MPHLVIQHTPNIDTDFNVLCGTLLNTLLSIRDNQDKQVFPEGGTRVLTFPATHFAVGDGKGNYGYMYLNLRIFEGRGAAVVKETGDKLMDAIRKHVEPIFNTFPMGITLNIEETPAAKPGPTVLSYEGFHNSLRAVFAKKTEMQ